MRIDLVIAVMTAAKDMQGKVDLGARDSITREQPAFRSSAVVVVFGLIVGRRHRRLIGQAVLELALDRGEVLGSGLLSLACCHWKRASSWRPTRQ